MFSTIDQEDTKWEDAKEDISTKFTVIKSPVVAQDFNPNTGVAEESRYISL